MTDELLEEKFKSLEKSIKEIKTDFNTYKTQTDTRLKNCEDYKTDIKLLTKSINDLTNVVDKDRQDTNEKLDNIVNDIQDIKEEPLKKAKQHKDTIYTAVITAIVSVVVGALITALCFIIGGM